MTGELEDRRRRRWALHNTMTGEIRAVITATEAAAARNVRDGETLLDIDAAGPVSGAAHYVDVGAVLARPVLEIEEPTGTIEIGGELELTLPEGAMVYIDGELSGEAEGGGAVIDFPVAGEYGIEVRLFPFRSASLTVVVE